MKGKINGEKLREKMQVKLFVENEVHFENGNPIGFIEELLPSTTVSKPTSTGQIS